MASINGISVKGIKDFYGHEGEPLCQGNLYLGNKKIGFWSQDSHGGPDNVTLDVKYSEQMLNKAIIARNPDKAFHGGTEEKPFVMEYDLERLLGDFISLDYDEKEFKKAVKKGYEGILVATDGYHQVVWSLPKSYTAMSDEALLKELGPDIEKAKGTFLKETKYTKHTVKVYRSPADFIIGDPVKVEEFTRKKDLNQMIAEAGKTAQNQQGAKDMAKKNEKNGPDL